MLRLLQVDRRSGLSRKEFAEEYLKPGIPLVFTDLMNEWPATQKWNLEYFMKEHGHLQVPVFTSNYSNPGKKYMSPDKVISFKEYLESASSGPTDLRMFLFNIFKEAPELCEDISRKFDIMDWWIDSYPFMFFGGEGSVTPLHYDIDCSNVFLNQLYGQKQVILFDQSQSKHLYHQPFTVTSAVDVAKPDFEKYPALAEAQGYKCVLQPGETLFMPSQYWHHVTYLDFGYSLSLRSNESIYKRLNGTVNIVRHYVVDKGLNQLMGEKWKAYKMTVAKRRAESVLEQV